MQPRAVRKHDPGLFYSERLAKKWGMTLNGFPRLSLSAR